MAAHLGIVDENAINNMSYIFFQDVLEALGKRINFESISNMYGKTVFDKKGGQAVTKMIQDANPLTKPATTNSGVAATMLAGATTVIKAGNKEKIKEVLGDTSWVEKFL